MDLRELLNPTGSAVESQTNDGSNRSNEGLVSVDSHGSLDELEIPFSGSVVREDIPTPYPCYLSKGYQFPPPSTAGSSTSDKSNNKFLLNPVEPVAPDIDYSRSLPRIHDLISNDLDNDEGASSSSSNNKPFRVYPAMHSTPNLRATRQMYRHHRKTSSWTSFGGDDIIEDTIGEGNDGQRGPLIPRRQTRWPRKVVDGRVYNGCQYTVHCDNRAPLRKVVSHIFGRNKRQTLSIPKHMWVYMCRKHYQREAYRKDSYPVIQAALVAEQIERFDIWGRVLDFQVRYGKVIYRRFNMGEIKTLVRAIINVLRNNMENKVMLRMDDIMLEEGSGSGPVDVVASSGSSNSNSNSRGLFMSGDSEYQQELSVPMHPYQHHHRRVTGDEDSYRFLDSLHNLATPITLTLDESRQMVRDLLSTASRGCVSRQHSEPSLSSSAAIRGNLGSTSGEWGSNGINTFSTNFAQESAGTIDPDQLTVYPPIEILPNVMV